MVSRKSFRLGDDSMGWVSAQPSTPWGFPGRHFHISVPQPPLFLLFMCMYMYWTCLHESVYVRNSPLLLLRRIHWGRVSQQTYSSLIWLVSIASWFQRCHLHLPRLELQADRHAHLAFTWVLRTWCIVFLLVSKHFSFSLPGGATGDFGVQGAFLNFIYFCGCRWLGLMTSTHLLSLLVCSHLLWVQELLRAMAVELDQPYCWHFPLLEPGWAGLAAWWVESRLAAKAWRGHSTSSHQEWWYMPTIPVLRKLKPDDYMFKTSLGYIVRFCFKANMQNPKQQ